MLTVKSRIESIIHTSTIGITIPNVKTLELADLNGAEIQNLPDLPNLRLGKQIERIFALLIDNSTNYSILKENVQVIENKVTVGEIDFIIQNNLTKQISHLEIVYKFYLYDPNQSTNELEKWIGPNRKDSFIEKFEKLKLKQFPLLFKPQTKPYLDEYTIQNMAQKLCFMANLFVPLSMLDQQFSHINNSAISGYWLTYRNFISQDHKKQHFYLPKKQHWGIEPQFNSEWFSYSDIILQIDDTLERQFSPLCWIKINESTFEQCFIVWW